MTKMKITSSCSGRIRVNFANTHLANAHRFALLVHQVESENAAKPFGPFIEDITANVVATIMSAVASLEAFLNEVRFDPTGHFSRQTPELVEASLALVERRSILERLAFLAVLNERPKPDLGCTSGQHIVAECKRSKGPPPAPASPSHGLVKVP